MRAAAWLAGLALFALPALAPAAPDIQHWRTSNGARVYFVPAPELPMVDLRVVFDAGGARDGGHPGLARLTNRALAEGTAELNADAVAERFESLGARFATESLRDMAVVSLRSLGAPDLLEPALETFAAVLSRPAFPAAGLERRRRQMRVALEEREQDPGALAARAFYRRLYGEHPYAAPAGGTRESLEHLDRAAVTAFYRRHYVAANAVVAIVGDLERADAQRLAERVTGGLAAGEPAPALPPVADPETAAHVHLEHPSAQTHVRVGFPGMARGAADYFALYVGNHVFGGGGFQSRLMQEVRSRRGYAYSVYSYFAPMHARGPFVMGLQTRNDQAEAALEVVRTELRRFLEQGPTAEELAAAKKNLTGGFPLRIDSNGEIVEYLSVIGFYQLPLDYLDTFTARVEAVTAEQVREAFRRRIDPARLVTVTVGGAAQG